MARGDFKRATRQETSPLAFPVRRETDGVRYGPGDSCAIGHVQALSAPLGCLDLRAQQPRVAMCAASPDSSLPRDRQPAPLALKLLNATAPEAESSFDEAKAVNSEEAEKATEFRWAYSFNPALRGLRLFLALSAGSRSITSIRASDSSTQFTSSNASRAISLARG